MAAILCVGCECSLGYFNMFPLDTELKYVWIECEAWKTQVPLCHGCSPSSELLSKIRTKWLPLWKLNPTSEISFGDQETLDEYATKCSLGKCFMCDCEHGDGKLTRHGWTMVHAKCVGDMQITRREH
jgi:hypothetical protein